MRLFILGSNGMLGRYLTLFFQKKIETIPLTRYNIDLTRSRNEIIDFFSSCLRPDDLIINSAGIIKQRDYEIMDMILVNSILPNILSEVKKITGSRVIHVTTDCVYNGKSGFYDEKSPLDAEDDYGRTKILGENSNNMNIRTSIIGEELQNKKSLIEWVKSKEKERIIGFDNHLWNGITCLELCKFINKTIEDESYWVGTRHIFSPNDVTKYELIEFINKIYKLNIQIEKKPDSKNCLRNLRTIYDQKITNSIRDQISEQKKFILK